MEEEKKQELMVPEVVEDEDELLGERPILSDEPFKFASLIAGGVAIPEAYKQAFPDKSSSKWVAVNAYRLAKNKKIRDYIDTIQQATRLQIILEMPNVFDRVKKLAEGAESERVQLDANLELWDRGGLKAPQRVESVQIGVFGSLDPEDMKKLIKEKLEKKEVK